MLNELVTIPGISTVVYTTGGHYELSRNDRRGTMDISREKDDCWSWTTRDTRGDLDNGGYEHSTAGLFVVVDQWLSTGGTQ